MVFEVCVMVLILLQVVKSEESGPKARITSMELGSLLVGDRVDFTEAEIEYDALIQIGINNKVVVRTNPSRAGAFIYMDVTDACEIDKDAFCEQKGNENLISDMRILLEHKGEGVYEGVYTVEGEVGWKASLTFFTVEEGINEYVYKDINYDRASRLRSYSPGMVHYGNNNPKYSGYEIFRHRGKWLFPESREYELKFTGRSYDDTTVQTCTLSLDYVKIFTVTFSEKDFTYLHPVVYVKEGEHDVTVECKGDAHQVGYWILWKHPADYDWNYPDKFRLRGFAPDPVMKVVKLVEPCKPGTFFNPGLGECLKCPRGTCQPNIGGFLCIPC